MNAAEFLDSNIPYTKLPFGINSIEHLVSLIDSHTISVNEFLGYDSAKPPVEMYDPYHDIKKDPVKLDEFYEGLYNLYTMLNKLYNSGLTMDTIYEIVYLEHSEFFGDNTLFFEQGSLRPEWMIKLAHRIIPARDRIWLREQRAKRLMEG